MKLWDVIIIGGGLAGSAAAIHLARAGKKVLLLEKEACAHHKVCGEFISSEAENYLSELGVDLKNLGAEPIKYIRIIRGDKATQARLPFSASSLSRFALDEKLLQIAIENGVHVKREANVTELLHSEEYWLVKYSNNETASASAVFLATGKHNLKGWPRAMGLQNDMIGFKMHFKLEQSQAEKISQHVEIILFDGGYAGLEPVENGLVNLCLVVRKSKFAQCQKDWSQLLKYISKSSPYFARRMHGASTSWKQPVAIFGIPYGMVYKDTEKEPRGIYRLGDQMAVIASFCGDGMAIALHTAQLAVANYLHKNSKAYHKEARDELEPLIKRADNISQSISCAFGQKIIHLVFVMIPKLLTVVAKGTRLKFFYNKRDHFL